MNEKDEPKNVDKLCPLLGSHMIPVVAKVPGVFGQQILGGEFKLVNCQKEKCEFWDKPNGRCSLALLAWGMTSITVEVGDFAQAIRDIVEYAKTLKEKPDGKG